MDDLISREKTLKALEDTHVIVSGLRFGKTILADYTQKVVDRCVDVIMDIPAESAESIRHGYWKTVGKSESGNNIRECSCCGRQRTGIPKYKYCPDCGAKMSNNLDFLCGQESFLI